ncbi:MAG: uroporphyrinogen-III synthase, partial [Saprospiraceae bacterium]
YISIGNTTSEVLKSLNINSSIAKSPSEIGITESLKGLYKEYYNGVAK